MKKQISPALFIAILSLALILAGGVILFQSFQSRKAEAQGAVPVSYTENWTAVSGTYAGSYTYWGICGLIWPVYSTCTAYAHMNGLPGNKASCAYAVSSEGAAIDCSATVTGWQVTGTIGP